MSFRVKDVPPLHQLVSVAHKCKCVIQQAIVVAVATII